MEGIYKTISKPSEAIFKDKGSKFIAYAFPVYSENQIKEIVDKLKKEQYKARHHCYAYQLGWDKSLYRVNDDGEPSNSAGKPIFGQIQSKDLSNVLIVVVRYFGGVLLGVGGLVNAYRTSAKLALENAHIIEKSVEEVWQIKFEYPAMNSVMKIVKDSEIEIIETKFEISCLLKVSIPLAKSEMLISNFSEIETVNCSLIEEN